MLISGWAGSLKTLLCLSAFNTLFLRALPMICASVGGIQMPVLIRAVLLCYLCFFLGLVVNWLWLVVSHEVISRTHKCSWLGYLWNHDNWSKLRLWVIAGQTVGDWLFTAMRSRSIIVCYQSDIIHLRDPFFFTHSLIFLCFSGKDQNGFLTFILDQCVLDQVSLWKCHHLQHSIAFIRATPRVNYVLYVSDLLIFFLFFFFFLFSFNKMYTFMYLVS